MQPSGQPKAGAMARPSKASLREIPELDLAHAKVLRRGPRPGRTLRLPLRAMREAAGKSQAEVGAVLDSDQAEMSKLERREDMMLSTLRRYAVARRRVRGRLRVPGDRAPYRPGRPRVAAESSRRSTSAYAEEGALALPGGTRPRRRAEKGDPPRARNDGSEAEAAHRTLRTGNRRGRVKATGTSRGRVGGLN